MVGAAAPARQQVDPTELDSFLQHIMSAEEPMTDDDEAILEELYERGIIDVDENGYISAPYKGQEVEIEMEPAYENPELEIEQLEKVAAYQKGEQAPAEQPKGDAEPMKKESKKDVIARRGQAEYETWVDPDFSSASMHANKPTVDVKRARELHFDDSGSYSSGNVIFVGIVGVCATVALMGTAVAGVAYYKLHKQHELSKEHVPSERRAVQGSVRGTARGDQRNAYSAQLNHYQQTKNEIIRMEQANGLTGDGHESEDSEQEGDEADYSVYECPGLAPTGDIEVSNPMFNQKKDDK